MRVEHYIESVLAKCEALKRSGLWAPEPDLRPAAWLENFADPQHKLIAAVLLDNFVYYSDRASDRLLVSVYNRFEDQIFQGRTSYKLPPHVFMEDLVFTPVEGEDPGPTDSGKTLCRRLRNLLEIDDDRFLDPPEALVAAKKGRPIVFVDDFLGSGQQLLKTWTRPYTSKAPISFQKAYEDSPFPVICMAIVSTEMALQNVAQKAPSIHIVAAHILDDTYRVQGLAAPVLDPALAKFQDLLRAFLANYAVNLELKDFLMDDDMPLFGFEELGLLFAFQHGVPDSTVPVLWAKAPVPWIRLVK